MTTQEVRNYLKQYKEADRRVKQLEREYNEELDQIDLIRSPMDTDGTPHGSGIGRTTEQRAIALISKAEKLQTVRLEAIEIRQRVYENIRKIPGEPGAVLYERYILLKKWEDIAYDLHYSTRNIFILHQKALEIASLCIVLQ